MNKSAICIFIVSILFLISFFYSNQNLTFSDLLKRWKVSLSDSGEFILNEFTERKVSGRDVAYLVAKSDDKVLKIQRITNMSKVYSKTYTQYKFDDIDSLFLLNPSPYPGEITRVISCPDDLKPIVLVNDSQKYYILFANDRFSYGICSKDLIKYKSVFTFVYCEKQKDLYQIEFFIPPDQFEGNSKLIHSFRCN